ncbi:MAG: hypothetical protein JXQ96_13000 [Cyclobacteriaceae bacterium]
MKSQLSSNPQSLLKLLLVLLLVLSASQVEAQVSDVKKSSFGSSSKSSEDNYSYNSGSSVFFFLEIIDIFSLMGQGHKELLSRKEEEPWLVSLEGMMHAGYYGKETATVLAPSIRGNWGLFSTQFRYNQFQDFTGAFPTFDWQVVQLNLVARPQFNLRVGTGFMHEIDNDKSLNEHYLGLDFHFDNRKINPTMEFRWAEDYERGITGRFEWNTRVDYRLMTVGKIDVNLMAGFMYQKYYESVNFYFAQTGINLNLY